MSSRSRLTLRARLTLVYAVLLTLALLIYAGCVSTFFLHSLREQLDRSLSRDIEAAESAVAVHPDGRTTLALEEGDEAVNESQKGEGHERFLIEVWSASGEKLYRSDALKDDPLGPAPANGKLQAESPSSTRLSSGQRVRVMGRLHELPNGQTVLVRLALTEESVWREFWEMSTALGVALPLVLLGVVIVGYYAAARALRPVETMAKRAASISADQLHERLEIDNPDDELGKLGTEFNTTLARLEASFDQLRRFTADASHELRTPLTAIRSVGEVAFRKPGDEKYYLNIIGSMLEESNRLTRLVDSLLMLSRADAGRVQLNLVEVAPMQLVREATTLLEVLADEKSQTVSCDGDADAIVLADPTILRQAFVNLIDNAVKYSPAGGAIRARVFTTNSTVTIEIVDSGPGIAQEHRSHIFERFYRVDKARTRAEGGTGLGLSIALWAVATHKGTIEVDSTLGTGSTFRINLPRHSSNTRK